MIICQNCKSNEPDGTIFCSECGTQLLQTTAVQTHKFDSTGIDMETEAQLEYERARQSTAWISLHLLDSGHILAFSDRQEFSIGRFSENQPVEPDVDLTIYKAFENGVSRLHTMIRHNKDGVSIVDLGSSNGTYINGNRIMPNVPQPLHHGDIVALGRLKMQIALA